jgi:hypothetical protein
MRVLIVPSTISNYSGKGVGRPNLRKDEHSIIYSGPVAPKPLAKENPMIGESGLLHPIKVDIKLGSFERLSDMSRINFAKVYTIEHNCLVRAVGRVNEGDLWLLHAQ